MDGQANARSGHNDSNERSENICEKRLRNRNRRTNDQRYKFLAGTRHIMVHPKSEGQTKTSKGYWKESNGCVRSDNHYGHSRSPFDNIDSGCTGPCINEEFVRKHT